MHSMVTYLKSLLMPLVLKVEALALFRDIWHLWWEHVMLHQPEAHVVVLPAPAPKVHTVPIGFLKLLPGEYADATKKVLSLQNFVSTIYLDSAGNRTKGEIM